MLQFILNDKSEFSLAEQTDMAIKAGCRWIQLPQEAGSLEKEEMEKIIARCKEEKAFLVIENNIKTLDDIRIHGIWFSQMERSDIRRIRDDLGGAPIIGVAIPNVEYAETLKGLDIDYLTIERSFLPADDGDAVAAAQILVDQLISNEIRLPLVVRGDIPSSMFKPLVQAGCSGVAVFNNFATHTDAAAEIGAIMAEVNAMQAAEASMQ